MISAVPLGALSPNDDIVTVACCFAGALAAVAPNATTTASSPAIAIATSLARCSPLAIPVIPSSSFSLPWVWTALTSPPPRQAVASGPAHA